ncbi:MAG: histidine kinase dimerization/phospho-acceptor domain-containing protein [Limisphaerales bacterium]
MGKLAGGMAQDFSNILAALVLTVELLQHDSNLPPHLKLELGEMKELIDRASSLTRQLLLFARQGVMQRKQLNLNKLLLNLTKMLRRLVGEHVTINLSLSPSPLWIHADPGMIEQVLTNLAVNSRDAMPDGGTIEITL